MPELYTLCIKRYRNMRRMSQSELAFKINKSQSFIAQIEKPNSIRTKSLQLITLVLISKALNVCCNDIIRFKCEDCWKFDTCDRHQEVKNDDVYFKDNLEYYL